MLAAGPSQPSQPSDDVQIDIELHDSPSGSDVGTAGPSRPSSVREINPNSPAPSESDVDEAGPSHRGYSVRFGPGPNLLEREAAPVGRSSSPVGQLRNRRNNLSDSCLISSSTGPVDSNPPTPEMFGLGGDIDSDYVQSPPVRRYIARFDEDEGVVDSTVDSTSIPFIMNDYEGNEVSQLEDESDGGEDTESESVAGSEASSTTSARYDTADHRLQLPGQDDNEGISTSGQVDIGQFRLVPNDFELPYDRRNVTAMEPSASHFVPDVQEIVLDEGPGAEAQQAPSTAEQSSPTVGTFKKPRGYNKKDRLMENNSLEMDDPMPGPSRLQQPPSNSTSAAQSNYEAADLFLVQEDYANNLGIGLAFSGLPSSVTLSSSASEESEESKERDPTASRDTSPLTGPLAKRLKTRHFQEQAKANLEITEEEKASGDNSVREAGPSGSHGNSEILRNSLEGKPRVQENVGQGSGSNETSDNMENFSAQPGQSNERESSGSSGSSKFLGGVQQNYSVTLETNNVYLSALQPKRNVHTKSAGELKEYLPVTYESLGLRDNTFDSIESFLSAESQVSQVAAENCFLNERKFSGLETEGREDRVVMEEMEETEETVDEATMMISDQPVQSRAVASLPTNYLSLRNLGNNNQAVLAARNIPLSCR